MDDDEAFIQTFALRVMDEFPHIDLHEYEVNAAANCGILARIIKFK